MSKIPKSWDIYQPLFFVFFFQSDMGLSENVGLIFPIIYSHLKTGLSDQQNHWVQWGTQHFQTHPYGHGSIPMKAPQKYQRFRGMKIRYKSQP